LRALDAGWTERRLGDRVAFAHDNPAGLGADAHPWARQVPGALRAAGIRPIAVALP
jgi:hypothetical protein